MLTHDEMTTLMRDYLAGRRSSVTGKDADAFLEEFKKDVELAKRKGWTIEIPFEIPDLE